MTRALLCGGGDHRGGMASTGEPENRKLTEWRERAGGALIDAVRKWVDHFPEGAIRSGRYVSITR